MAQYAFLVLCLFLMETCQSMNSNVKKGNVLALFSFCSLSASLKIEIKITNSYVSSEKADLILAYKKSLRFIL